MNAGGGLPKDGEAGPARIYLVRHGRTVMNAEVRFRGRLEVPLDAVGRAEALTTAQRLSTIGLTAAYTSPLARAREVAIAIAAASRLSRVDDEEGLTNIEVKDGELTLASPINRLQPDPHKAAADTVEEAAPRAVAS